MFMRIVVYAPIIGVGAIIKVLNTNASMTWIIALVVVVIMAIMGVAFAVVMPRFSIIQKLLDKMNSVLREFLDVCRSSGRSIPRHMKKRNLIRSMTI